MFQKLSSIFSFFKNFDKIKETVVASYVAIVKTENVLEFLNNQIDDTALGKLVGEYIPKILKIVNKIKILSEKYAPFVGITLPTVAQSNAVKESLIDDLDASVDELNELVRK